jgi:hypothetical protein
MLASVDPRAPTAFLTSLTEPLAACFWRVLLFCDLGMTGFWAMGFLRLFYGLRRRLSAKSQGYRLQCPATVVQHQSQSKLSHVAGRSQCPYR